MDDVARVPKVPVLLHDAAQPEVLLILSEGDAPCAQADPELWFSSHPSDQAEAVRICKDRCRYRVECRNAGRNGREWGVWGGETETQRKRAGYMPRGK